MKMPRKIAQKLCFYLGLNSISKTILWSVVRTYLNFRFCLFLILFMCVSWGVGDRISSADTDLKDLCGLFLTYNSLVLSFSLASMTLVTALPSQQFVLFLARERVNGERKTRPLENLILAFFRAAVAHYVSVIATVGLFVFGSPKILTKQFFELEHIYYFSVALLQGWALVCFAYALRDVCSLGVLYARHIASQRENTSA